MATGNMQKKFSKVQPCSFKVMSVDKQTNKQADILITILYTPPLPRQLAGSSGNYPLK